MGRLGEGEKKPIKGMKIALPLALRDQHWVLVLLLALTLTRGCLYMLSVPPWQAPDETGHFEYAWTIAHLGRIPSRSDLSPAFEQELLSSLYEWRYGDWTQRPLPERMPARLSLLPSTIFARRSRTLLMGRFSLSYLWQALFICPFQYQDLVFQLYAARVSSVALNLAIVWLAWRFFHNLVPRGWATAMTAFVVFLPQHTYINATVNEGPLAELAACVVLYAWLRVVHEKISAKDVAAVLIGTVVGVWAKKTTLFLVPLDLLMLGFLVTQRFKRTPRSREVGIAILLTVLVVGLVAAALRTDAGQETLLILKRWWSTPQFYLENGQVSIGQVLWYTLDSFWAQFGWMNVRVGHSWYVAIYLLIALALEGWLLPRSREWEVPSGAGIVMGGALLLAIGTWITFVITAPSGLSYYQGRYLFPVVVPIAFYLVSGWARWTPPRFQRYAPSIIVVLMALLDAIAWFLSLVPYFYTQ